MKETLGAMFRNRNSRTGTANTAQEPGTETGKCAVSGAVASDVGCVRSNNEDNYILGKNMNQDASDCIRAVEGFAGDSDVWKFAGVFDGMGGGEAGELASRDSAVIFLAEIERLPENPVKSDVDTCMRGAFLQANNRIIDLQAQYEIFGTTGTVVVSDGFEFKLYHLGDSRAYLFRGGALSQLTRDQTLAQMKLEMGMYRENDPAEAADRHKLTEYIGRDWTKENLKPVESLWMTAGQGDLLLLCSDGLYDMCSDAEIAEILGGSESLEEKVTAMVRRARETGGEDNITCMLVAFD